MNQNEPNVDANDPDVDRVAANQDQRQLDGPTDFDTADHARDLPVDPPGPDSGEHDDGSIADSIVTDPANPYPTGDDPYVSPNDPDEEAEPVEEPPQITDDAGPTYERDQGPFDRNDGGTTDSHNTLTSSETGLREEPV